MSEEKPIYRILYLEDEKKDAELIVSALKNEKWEADIKHVDNERDFIKALQENEFDIALVDHSRQRFAISDVLKRIKEAANSLPVIIVMGAVTDKTAEETLAMGAVDHVLKDKLFRLPSIISRAIKKAKLVKEKEKIEASYQQFANTSPVGFFKMDQEGRCSYVNEGVVNMTGHSKDALMGDSWVRIIYEDDRERFYRLWLTAFERKKPFEAEARLVHKDGSVIWILSQAKPEYTKEGEFEGYVGAVFDITRLKETELRLQELSYYDTLTNLANRRFFQETLHKSLAAAKRYKEKLALFYVDLDSFKNINDTKGHGFGDKILEEVGERFNGLLRENDFVARIGGDEFAVIMNKYQQEKDIVTMAERIVETLSTPYKIDNEIIHSSASIGIALYPHGGDTTEDLLQHADLALYRAKSLGQSNYQFYSHDIQEKIDQQVVMENHLRTAIEKEELYLLFQPQLEAKSRNLAGFEVLLRWQNPELGTVLPETFIPVAEGIGYMCEIGLWVLENAVQQYMVWKDMFDDMGFEDIFVSINVSPAQITYSEVSRRFINKINSLDISPKSILIEATETAYMHNPELLQEVLQEISALGASIAIDNFGTGYSSLNIIEKLPIDFLKIDKDFVRYMFSDKHNIPIIKAIISLSKNLEVMVVAEGVETEQQAETLTKIGCDYLQGFFFSEPLKVKEMEEYIREMLNKK
jgi:diguanylate cyclase (GGDEF)-like protein/PAS domain S-box-containing protein